jgi:superoxide reductase
LLRKTDGTDRITRITNPLQINRRYKVAFGDILKNKDNEGKEKHVPIIEISTGSGGADTVNVVVGKEVAHPNTIEHHIAWLEVYGVKGDGQVISLARADFAPAYTSPKVQLKVLLADFETIYATSYCNIHGLWEYSLKV